MFCKALYNYPVSLGREGTYRRFVAVQCETGAVGERGRVARGHCRRGCIVLPPFAVDGGECTAFLGILGPGESRRSRQILVYGEFLFGCTLLPHTGVAVPLVGVWSVCVGSVL